MHLDIVTGPVEKQRGDFFVLFLENGKPLADPRSLRPWERGVRNFQKLLKEKKATQETLLSPDSSAQFARLYVAAVEFVKHIGRDEKIRTSAAKALGFASSTGCGKMAFIATGAAGASIATYLAEGVLIGNYRFDKYKKTEGEKVETNVTLLVDANQAGKLKKSLGRIKRICDGMNLARNLVNEPQDVVYPEVLARVARDLGRKHGMKVIVLDEKELKRQKYNGLITVGKGSIYPPRMIIMRYQPRRKSRKHLCLLGKGLTFDTGGICIKPASKMWEMKGDMAGSAAVLGAMKVIAQAKPSLQITAIICSAQNAIDAKAAHPGDIFRAKNGKTVMIDNTDAEGRLVLTDGLHRAGEEGATHVVDVATLTGACARALGTSVSGILGTSDTLIQQVIKAGQSVGEDIWQLPLYEEYRTMFKCEVADIVNSTGSPYAGAITAALFLKEFVPKGIEWAHLDIAGTFINAQDDQWRYFRPGATGVMVRTFVELARSMEP
ncbi:MAG: leucyl aminopeptidase [bacterium]